MRDDARARVALPLRLIAALGVFAALVGVAHTWTHRYELLNLDAVSYLDIADAWRTAGWRAAVNGYWSPLYSWLLAAAMAIAQPPRAAEYVFVHLLNLGLFLASFAACALLVRELLREGAEDTRADATITWSPGQLLAISLVLWIWMAMSQLVIWLESPDLLVAIATFVAAAMLVKLRRSDRMRDGFMLGVALGAGYLAKAAMLPLSIVYLIVAAATARRRWRQLPMAIAGLAMVAGPWIGALSVVKGRLTTGDAGRLNYIWFVGHSEDFPHRWPRHWPHWDGVGASGTPMHPAPLLLDQPAAYDLSTSTAFAATYPPWHDPARLYEGVDATPNVRDQLRRLRLSVWDVLALVTVNFYERGWMNPQLPLLALVIVAWLASGPAQRRWRVDWALVVPALASIGLYSLVYVEPRYLGAAICVMWIALIAGIRLPRDQPSSRLLQAAAAVGTALVAFAIISATVLDSSSGWRRLLRGDQDALNISWHVAVVMRQAGIGEHTPVAVVGNGQVASRWARLGRVKIVVEVPAADLSAFTASPEAATRVIRALERSSARFVLAERIPPDMPGWRALEGTPYWVMPVGSGR